MHIIGDANRLNVVKRRGGVRAFGQWIPFCGSSKPCKHMSVEKLAIPEIFSALVMNKWRGGDGTPSNFSFVVLEVCSTKPIAWSVVLFAGDSVSRY